MPGYRNALWGLGNAPAVSLKRIPGQRKAAGREKENGYWKMAGNYLKIRRIRDVMIH